MKDLLRGAMNGAVATVPQSLTILAGRALGLLHTPPPEQITETAMEKVGIEPAPSAAGTGAAILALHFAYGAAGGAAFSTVRPWLPGNDLAAGIGFGLAVWAGSYYGIMPALDLYPAAGSGQPRPDRDDGRRPRRVRRRAGPAGGHGARPGQRILPAPAIPRRGVACYPAGRFRLTEGGGS